MVSAVEGSGGSFVVTSASASETDSLTKWKMWCMMHMPKKLMRARVTMVDRLKSSQQWYRLSGSIWSLNTDLTLILQLRPNVICKRYLVFEVTSPPHLHEWHNNSVSQCRASHCIFGFTFAGLRSCRRHSRGKSSCSEICMRAINVNSSAKHTPRLIRFWTADSLLLGGSLNHLSRQGRQPLQGAISGLVLMLDDNNPTCP